MAVSIRGLAGKLNAFEIVAARGAFGALVFLTLLAVHPPLRIQISLRHWRLHLLRNGTAFAAQVAWVYSVLVLPLATVTALEFTAPAWSAVFAILFLHEVVTAARIATVVMGIIGVLIIVRPGATSIEPALLLMLAVPVGFAISYIFTKKLTAGETTFAILFWMNMIHFPLGLMGVDATFPARLDASQILPLLGVGITGITAHLCMTNAFRAGDAQVVVPLDFLRLPLIALVGWILYAERIDSLLFLGAGFIILGILVNLRSEARRARSSMALSDTTLPSP
jgi:drug/metabolite transporter (DMT)-like permease